MTWVAVGVGVVGAGVQMAGQMKQGKQAKETGEANARLGRAQAQDSLLRGAIEESMYRRQIASIVGGQKAAFGARNVAVSGTALDILSDTAQIGEEDVINIRNNAAREAWGYRMGANESSRWGANQLSNAKNQALGTLLTSGAQAYGTWAGR